MTDSWPEALAGELQTPNDSMNRFLADAFAALLSDSDTAFPPVADCHIGDAVTARSRILEMLRVAAPDLLAGPAASQTERAVNALVVLAKSEQNVLTTSS